MLLGRRQDCDWIPVHADQEYVLNVHLAKLNNTKVSYGHTDCSRTRGGDVTGHLLTKPVVFVEARQPRLHAALPQAQGRGLVPGAGRH